MEIKFKAYIVEQKKGRQDKNGFPFKIQMRSVDPTTVQLQGVGEEMECEVIVRPTGNGLPEVE